MAVIAALLAPAGTIALSYLGLLSLWPAWLILLIGCSAAAAAYWIPPQDVHAQHAAASSISIGSGAVAALVASGILVTPVPGPGIGLALPVALGAALIAYPVWFGLQRLAQKFWETRRRFPAIWECTGCGYNLTGNTTGRCPECGRYLNLQQMRLVRDQQNR